MKLLKETMAEETQAQMPPDLSREDRLEQVLAEYLRHVEQGVNVDQQVLLADHPDLADELREFFGNQMRMQRLVGPSPTSRNGTPSKLRYFGDYEILEEIAHGGMGVVYKARQTSLNRIVAVKMILAGQLANESDVKRFQAEAEAAANLHHPGVVGIYEVGVQDGQHYYSMEYIDGRNLSAVLSERPVGIVQTAAYVREIAEIVEYAHSQGVLHRDLKPSNVLIDLADRLRITDFGLAKRVQSESDLTMTGQVLGTPSYMSPEQAAAQHALIGPGSDVYSLGTILYEMLTGRPPFRSENIGETLRQVQQEEPLRPRLLNPKLPRDLETICLKCLEKETRRRYASAQHLADELVRFLRGEPILARPVGPVSRAWRWCRRKPVIASLATLLLGALLTSVGILGVSNIWISRERDKTSLALEQKGQALIAVEKSEQFAKTQEELARRNLRKALQAVDQMLTRVANERLANVPQMEQVRRTLLEDAHKLYQDLLQDQSHDAGLRFEIATSYCRIGRIWRLLGEPDAAAWAVQQSIDLSEKLVVDNPSNTEYRRHLADSYQLLGFTFAYESKPREGEKAYEKALTLYRVLVAETGSADYRFAITEIHEGLATAMSGVGRNVEALGECRKGLAIAESLVADHPEIDIYQGRLANVLYLLGVILQRSGQPVDAEPPLRRAIELFKKQADEYPDQPGGRHLLAMSHIALGNALNAIGQEPEAEEAATWGLELEQKLTIDFPTVADFRLHRNNGRLLLDAILNGVAPPDEIENQCRHAVVVWEKYLADFPGDSALRDDVMRSHWRLGDFLQSAGRHREAETAYTRAIELQPGDAATWIKRATARELSGDVEKSIADYSKAIDVAPKSFFALNRLAWLLATCPVAKLRDPHRALELAKKATEIDPEQGDLWTTLGVAQYRAGDWKEAIKTLTKSMELRNQGDCSEYFFLAMSHDNLGERATALKWFDKGVLWLEKNQAQNDEFKRFRTEAAELLGQKIPANK